MIVKRIIASWCAAATIILFAAHGDFTFKEFAGSVNVLLPLGIMAGIFAALSVIGYFTHRYKINKIGEIDDYFLAASVLAYAFVLVWRYNDFYFYIGVMVVVAIACLYLTLTDRLRLSAIPSCKFAALTIAFAAGLFCLTYIAFQTCYRYFTYSTPNFDFGIFVNMFHNMRESLQPLTTCERDGLLSHFAVHISPIYYLILPFYWLFPYQITLQIAQAVIVASAVIPLFMLARQKGLSYKATSAVCLMYCAYPAVYGGCFYDIHENCFLTPLLLWLFYFIERKSYAPVFIFALLTLTVKEDAAVYVIFAGLFILIDRRDWKRGVTLMAMAVGYFLGAAFLLNKFGEGIMASRYSNYITEDGGLLSVVINLFRNPALVISEAFTPDKLLYLAQMMIPLCFLPFATKKPARLLLLLPMLLINLMTDYTYQFSIYFQYVFGVIAFLFYAVILNLSELSAVVRRSMATLAVLGCTLFFCSETVDRGYYLNKYSDLDYEYETFNEVLASIPDDASVKASTFLVPKLAQRSEIYELETVHDAEYCALDLRYEKAAYIDALIESYENKGYELIDYRETVIALFRKINNDTTE